MTLKLKALAASLVLAAVGGHAGAAIHAGDTSDRAFDAKLTKQASLDRLEAAGLHLSAFPGANGGGVAAGSVKTTEIPRANRPVAANVEPPTDARLSAPATAPVPEPGSWAIFLAGVLGAGAIARRRMSS